MISPNDQGTTKEIITMPELQNEYYLKSVARVIVFLAGTLLTEEEGKAVAAQLTILRRFY